MSESTASLRRKIDSAGDLQSVVRTMKALAASRIGQYERSLHALADYDRAVKLGLAACFRAGTTAPARVEREARPAARAVDAVVYGSDQGLVGRFNEVVVDHALATLAAIPGTPRVWAVGERVQGRLANAGLLPLEVFSVPSSVHAITPLVGELLLASETRHGQHEVTELYLFHNSLGAGAAYAPVGRRLLPLDETWRRELAGKPWPTRNPPEILGSSTATLRALIREHLFISIFRACAESLASENASRLAAMERADRNIDELLREFNGAFHRLRQSGIDEELFDVISGFEALSKDA